MKNLVVDFIIPEVAGEATSSQEQAPEAVAAKAAIVMHNLLGTCQCGSDSFVLANEMTADTIKGIPASRMYECTACGDYRLFL